MCDINVAFRITLISSLFFLFLYIVLPLLIILYATFIVWLKYLIKNTVY